MASSKQRDALSFPTEQTDLILPYTPEPFPGEHAPWSKPHVTLTFATSLDSNLSLAPGVQTPLSGPQSKAMTHYLRSKHDVILIGVGTAIADDPSLNCRIEGAGGYGGQGRIGQPRPVIVDPEGRWDFNSETKCIRLAWEGKAHGPWIITKKMISDDKRRILDDCDGQVFVIEGAPLSEDPLGRIRWVDILKLLSFEYQKSVMIEGGGSVINDLLSPTNIDLVDSVIVTVAPTWLGRGGVQVCPEAREENGVRVPVARLTDVKWVPLGEDVVLCGRPNPKQRGRRMWDRVEG